MLVENGNYGDLKQIIAGLRKEEIKLIRLRLSESVKSERVTNSMKLFGFILDNPHVTEEKSRIFMRETKNTFTKTVSRLLEKLDYILLSESNIIGNPYYSMRFRTFFDINNKLLAAEYYHTKGIQHRGDTIVNEAIEQARSIEEYGTLIEFLFLKYRWYLLRGQKKEGTGLLREIEHYEFCRKSLFDTMALYYDLGSRISRYATKQIKAEVLLAINLVRSLAIKTQSVQIQYYHLILEFNVSVEYNQLPKSFEVAKEFLRLVTENEFLKKDMNLGIANMYIAVSHLVNRQFEQALKYCRISKTFFAARTYNYFHIEELEFYALFFLNDFKGAEELLLDIIQNPSYTRSKYLENKKEYLLACVYFAQERYNESQRLLNSINEIPKDKAGWNLGIKNLAIMLAIVKNDYDLTVRLVESYERDLKRIKKTYRLRQRDLLIYKLFRQYAKQGSAGAAIENLGSEFTTLNWLDNDYVQIIPGHELIAVNEWFECLARKSKYSYHGKVLTKQVEHNIRFGKTG